MSGIDNARMIALEASVSALNLRVQTLEGIIASQGQRLAAQASATPSKAKPTIQWQKPAAPQPAQATRQNRKPAATANGHPAASEPTIFYNPFAKKAPLPNEPERVHLMAIQRLKADGTPKAETVKKILDTYPDLCKGHGKGTEEAREIFVSNIVEMQWSDHAPKLI